jgi:hypothetical protein
LGKYIIALNTNLSLGAQYSETTGIEIQNGMTLPYTFENINFYLKSSSKITNNLSGKYSLNYSANSNIISNDDFANNRLNQLNQTFEIDGSMSKNLVISVVMDDITVNQSGQQNFNYFFSDINLRYTMVKIKTVFELALNNICDVRSVHSYYIDVNSLSSINYRIPGRIFLIRAIFGF